MRKDYDIEDAFAAIEDELIDSMIRNMKRHRLEEDAEEKQWEMWQALQLKSLEEYKQKNKKKFMSQFSDINGRIDEVLREANKSGYMDQEITILEAIKKGFTGYKKPSSTMQAEFFKLNERKLDALIMATTDDMKRAEVAILRMANDQYRKAIFNAQVYANSGAGTYEKAVDMATKDMLSSGLNCVEYSNGARHTLKDYADMAIRTASKRAYLQGEGAKRQEWGISTVIVNKRGNPCPKCLPFCGKVLIDDVWSGGSRKDGPYPLMSKAIAAGLYHPRCKDSHTTYFEGISTPPDDKYTKKEIKEIEQRYLLEQKRLYAKRQKEKYKRLADNSLDGDEKKKYQLKKKEWSKIYRNYRYPIDEDNFTSLVKMRDDNKSTDVIRPHNIKKELSKSSIGRDAYQYTVENLMPIYLLYNVENPEGLSGEYDPFDRGIYIYADKTKTIKETALTIIHEVEHDKLGHTQTRKEEVRCFLQEEKHIGTELTYKKIKDIIKLVNKNEVYKDLPWR